MVAVFFDKWLLIYVKPVVPVSLVLLYMNYVKKVNPLFPICMAVITATDVFIYIDFIKYYDIIAILISVFYALCILQLKRFISKEDIKLKVFISPPAMIGTILIAYLIFSISELALPKLRDSIGTMVLIIASLLFFSAVSFFIYLADKHEKSIYLFIAACCTLFVDALLAVSELYYYKTIFTVLINIAEIVGVYFFTLFFLETKPIDAKSSLEKYF